MADSEKKEDVIAVLSRKIDYEAKFTRMIVVICCLAVLASTFYCLTSMVEVLPAMVYTTVLGKLDGLQREWHALEKMPITKEQMKKSSSLDK